MKDGEKLFEEVDVLIIGGGELLVFLMQSYMI